MCVSFGMMLGWPSPTNPLLLQPKSEIPINLDQSASIAGMLMFGCIISPIISQLECLDTHITLITCTLLLSTGCILISFATSVLHLCIGRFCAGFASGMCTYKYKNYVSTILSPKTCLMVAKSVPILIGMGIAISYTIGPFVYFRQLAKMAAVVPIVSFIIFLLCLYLPKQLYAEGTRNSFSVVARNVIENNEKIPGMIILVDERKALSFIEVIKIDYNIKCLLLLILIICIQQFTGGPSTIVYNQLIYRIKIRPAIHLFDCVHFNIFAFHICWSLLHQ